MIRCGGAMNTRRQFLITAPLGALGAAVRVPRRRTEHPDAGAGDARCCRRPSAPDPSPVHPCRVHLRRGGTPRPSHDERERATDGGRELGSGRWRASSSAASDREKLRSSRRSPGDALEPRARRRELRPDTGQAPAKRTRSRTARIGSGNQTLASRSSRSGKHRLPRPSMN